MKPTSNDQSSGTAIVITLLAIVFAPILYVTAGRDPLILYLLTTPFAIVLLWLSRNVRVWDEPIARREERPTPARAKSASSEPSHARA
jgi:hypothetical protein